MRLKLAAALLLIGSSGAFAQEPQAWGQRASNTWMSMGIGMHVMLGKIGIGDMAGRVSPPTQRPLITNALAKSTDQASIQNAVLTVGETTKAIPAVLVSPSPSPPYLLPRLLGMSRLSAVDATLLSLNTRDFAASALTTGVAVGIAGYTCGTLGASLGPVTAGAAYFGCSWAGSYVADKGLRALYAKMGMVPDEISFGVGQIAGTVVGGWQAAHGIANAATRQMLKSYGVVTSSTFKQALPGMGRQFSQLATKRIAAGVVGGYFGLAGPAQAGTPDDAKRNPMPSQKTEVQVDGQDAPGAR